MSGLDPGVTGRKAGQDETSLTPLLVSVKQARVMLGNVSHNRFWKLAPQLELVGTQRKRYVVVASLQRYVDAMQRAPYCKGDAS